MHPNDNSTQQHSMAPAINPSTISIESSTEYHLANVKWLKGKNNKPHHEKTGIFIYVNNKDADQLRGAKLISAFVFAT